MKHSDELALDDHRHSKQRRDSLLAQNRIQDVGMIHVRDEDRHALGRDAPGEALSQRNPHAAFDLLLDSFGGACHELL